MGVTPTFADCDCISVMQSSGFACGCGSTHAPVPEARIIHWGGQHWYLICAFRQALTAQAIGV